MSNLADIIIETDRLKIVSTSQEYINDIFRELTKEVTRFMNPKPPDTLEEVAQFITTSRNKMSKGEELSVAILHKSTGEFLGHGGVHEIPTNTPALGIWIKKGAHGHKYGREAVKGLKEWADKNLTYHYLRYPVDKRNVASRKIPESLGGVIETEYPKTNMLGKVLDLVEYRIYPVK